jgi:hypothetical protein
MRNLILTMLLVSAFASCKKENDIIIDATLIQQSGCMPGAWLVDIADPNHSRHPFLCNQPPSPSSLDCSNTVIILNVPSGLAQTGKKVRFSKWDDKGIMCFSSTQAPTHLEVYDLSAR